MKYVSTRAHSPLLNFKETLFKGLAKDGGLYLPERLPNLKEFIQSQEFKEYSYSDLSAKLLYPFVEESIPWDDFLNINHESYQVFSNPSPPLKDLGDNLFLLELFHGPTLAFKDYGLQFIARLFNYFIKKNNQQLLILGATSGDTGSAAIEAFKKYSNVQIVILHPYNKISSLQRKQMTTVISDNVWNLAVDGNFDDCQKLVKQCFQDQSFLPNSVNLTAINSINWGRIMAQIVYYFSAFSSCSASPKEDYHYCIPTGNFGNVFSGYLAMKMGLPIKKLIVACNSNNILDRFLADNDYSIAPLKQTLSPSMDILISSNLERLLYEIHNPYPSPNNDTEHRLKIGDKINNLILNLQNQGCFKLDKKNWQEIKKKFISYSINDETTITKMIKTFKNKKILIDPHTAVGLGAVESLTKNDYSDITEEANKIILATAHPGKFPNAIAQVQKQAPEISYTPPNILKGIENKPEKFLQQPNSLNDLKELITKKVLN